MHPPRFRHPTISHRLVTVSVMGMAVFASMSALASGAGPASSAATTVAATTVAATTVTQSRTSDHAHHGAVFDRLRASASHRSAAAARPQRDALLSNLTVLGERAKGVYQPSHDSGRLDGYLKSSPPAPYLSEQSAKAVLLPLSEGRLQSVDRHNAQATKTNHFSASGQASGQASGSTKPVMIGIERSLVSENQHQDSQGSWQDVGDGHAAWFTVVSPDASALRLGLDSQRLPPEAQVRINDGRTIHAVTGADARRWSDRRGIYWTAAALDGSTGDTASASIEVFVPSSAWQGDHTVHAIGFPVTRVSHLLVDPFKASGPLAPKISSSGACMVDASCSVDELGTSFELAKNSVANMVFQTDEGSFTCTGTALNDTDETTQVPYFYTAHHCISDNEAANTLLTFWQYESPSCGESGIGDNTQVAHGAVLLDTQPHNDATLLRLNDDVPLGTWLSGWSTQTLDPSHNVLGIHHPSSDVKKVSTGQFTGFMDDFRLDGQAIESALKVAWRVGSTEAGSSGSGLFILQDGQYLLRGGLMGGTATCGNVGQPEAAGNLDVYSRFENVLPGISAWLVPDGSLPDGYPTRDYTGAWYNPAESGWGLLLYQYGNQVLFSTLFIYDNEPGYERRPTWVSLLPRWTGQDFAAGDVVLWDGTPIGPSFDPHDRARDVVGSFTLDFTHHDQVIFDFDINGVQRVVELYKIL